MMSAHDLDIVSGCAIDNEETTARHQMIGMTDDTLHYTVFYKPLNGRIDFETNDNFFDLMCNKTPNSREEKAILENQYTKFLKSIRPHGKNSGFVKNVETEAITFDITKNSFSVRPTIGIMTDTITYKQADNLINIKRGDRELLQCYKFIKQHCCNYYIENDSQYRNMGQALTQVTMFIQKNLPHMAFKENMDGVFRVMEKNAYLNMDEHLEAQQMPLSQWIKRYGTQYKSVNKYNKRNNRDTNILESAVMPVTAGRKDIDYFNIAVVAEFKKYGVNPFPEETSIAVANYKRHVATWQKLGLLSA